MQVVCKLEAPQYNFVLERTQQNFIFREIFHFATLFAIQQGAWFGQLFAFSSYRTYKKQKPKQCLANFLKNYQKK